MNFGNVPQSPASELVFIRCHGSQRLSITQLWSLPSCRAPKLSRAPAAVQTAHCFPGSPSRAQLRHRAMQDDVDGAGSATALSAVAVLLSTSQSKLPSALKVTPFRVVNVPMPPILGASDLRSLSDPYPSGGDAVATRNASIDERCPSGADSPLCRLLVTPTPAAAMVAAGLILAP